MKGAYASAMLLAAWVALVDADPVAQLPAPWAQRLEPVAEVDVTGADPAEQQAVSDTRAELAGLLADPDSDRNALANAFGRLGAHYQNNAVVGAAEAAYRDAAALNPADVHWPYYLADLLIGDGRPQQALDYLARARKLKPDYRPLDLLQGRALYALDRLEQARPLLERAAREPGLEASAAFYLGQIELLQRHYQAAATRFERSLALDPGADRVHYPLAQALRALGRGERARAELARMGRRLPALRDPLVDERKALNTGARPHFERAMAAVQRRDYRAAARAFAAGLALAPDNADARVSFARALYLDGHGDQAREQLTRVLAAKPGHVLAAFLSALLHQQDGDLAGARALYRRVLAAAPTQPGAHFFLAGLEFRAGNYAAAARHYATALAANPDIAAAAVLRLVALSRTPAGEAAVAAPLGRALAAAPDDPLTAYAAARFLLLARDPGLRDRKRALAMAESLAMRLPSPPNLALLALAEAGNGEADKAAEVIRRLRQAPVWMRAPDTGALKAQADALARGETPTVAWPEDDPLLRPPPLEPDGPMREYPAAVPF